MKPTGKPGYLLEQLARVNLEIADAAKVADGLMQALAPAFEVNREYYVEVGPGYDRTLLYVMNDGESLVVEHVKVTPATDLGWPAGEKTEVLAPRHTIEFAPPEPEGEAVADLAVIDDGAA